MVITLTRCAVVQVVKQTLGEGVLEIVMQRKPADASTFLIAIVAGGIPENISFRYSLTRNIALLSPHNIVRALAVQLSGYQFDSANENVRYVGFTVSAEGLAIVLLTLSSI